MSKTPLSLVDHVELGRDLAATRARLIAGVLEDFLGRRPTWQHDALCRGMNPDLFHPIRGESCAEAKAVCAGCPVSEECLDHALAHNERAGIWGGMSEKERRKLAKSRRSPAA